MPIFGPGSSTGIGLSSLALPLRLPSAPAGFANIVITLEDKVGENEGEFDFNAQAFDWQSDRLSASVTLPAGLTADRGRAWVAFLAATRGKLNPFLLGDTSQPFPRGSVPGVPVVDGASQQGRQLAVRGFDADAVKVLRSGDWFHVGTGLTQRLYMNLLDVDADGSGNAVLDICPSLREAPADGAPLVFNRPQGLFVLTDNMRKYSVNQALMYGISFDAKEYLR